MVASLLLSKRFYTIIYHELDLSKRFYRLAKDEHRMDRAELAYSLLPLTARKMMI